ncbi:hypothetical protein [Anaplasma phagocytophilum]|uniref:hypothetical protein n=1 Tax=Anaplasma phagocytophilum TaxID=948 RepID=UPI0015DDA982|nr:hypothetical protein [Anaplasma phagocytophilum]
MGSIKIKLVDDLGLYPSIPRVLYKAIQGSIIREDEADTVYLLAKELAYDVVTDQADKLGDALAKTSGKDIVQFAKAVGVSHPSIDKKVCTKTHAKAKDAASTPTEYEEAVSANGKTAQCSGFGSDQPSQTFSKFAEVLDLGKRENWPTGRYRKNGGSPDVQVGDANSNAKAVATDLVALNRDEKTIVAGLLAKTIEGGEVVERCLSTST